jgi:hypothetical protein
MVAQTGIYAVAGSKFYIGSTLAQKTVDFVLSDFNSQSWVEIKWAENLGQFGDEAASIAFAAIGNPRVTKLKGVRDAGTMALVFGVDYNDDGQTLLRTGQTTSFDYAFKVLFNDMPSGGTSGSVRYFIGKIMMARETLDAANNVIKLNAGIGINSNVVAVNAF